jgi:hypothetical protein
MTEDTNQLPEDMPEETRMITMKRAADMRVIDIDIPAADVWIGGGDFGAINIRIKPDLAPRHWFTQGDKGIMHWMHDGRRFEVPECEVKSLLGSQIIVSIMGSLEEFEVR